MLGADLIGFQTHSYARHFRQTVSRILALEALPKGIQLSPTIGNPDQGAIHLSHTFVDVAVFPMGIDVQNLTRKRGDPDVAEWVRALKTRYKGVKMIVARDKLDEVQVYSFLLPSLLLTSSAGGATETSSL